MMKKMSAIAVLFCLVATLAVWSTPADAGEKKYKIAWSTIYLTPSWMQQTRKMMEDRIQHWNNNGVPIEFYIANANGDSSQQIAHIENLISQGYDAIIVISGSATALNNAVEKAYDNGVVIINFDSLVTTNKVHSKINTSQFDYGKVCAEWLVKAIGGKGEIIAFNGPSGVGLVEERYNGAKSVLKNYPDISIAAELYCEYNEGPAMTMVRPALTANPDVAGVLALGGSQASASLKALEQMGMDMIPITGENYNAFLKEWARLKDEGFSSYAVGQPNWLGVLSIDQALRVLKGEKVDKEVIVPLPAITNENLSDFIPNDFPDDGYPIKMITEEDIKTFLTPKS